MKATKTPQTTHERPRQIRAKSAYTIITAVKKTLTNDKRLKPTQANITYIIVQTTEEAVQSQAVDGADDICDANHVLLPATRMWF